MRYQIKHHPQGASNTAISQKIGRAYEYLQEARQSVLTIQSMDKASHHVYVIVDTVTGRLM